MNLLFDEAINAHMSAIDKDSVDTSYVGTPNIKIYGGCDIRHG